LFFALSAPFCGYASAFSAPSLPPSKARAVQGQVGEEHTPTRAGFVATGDSRN
jgi:hypothetical protein